MGVFPILHACPDEAHLAALLHYCGTEVAVIAQVCTAVRQGKMAVLLVVVAAEPLQAFFPATHQAHAGTRSACPTSVSPPVAAVWQQDTQRASSRPPRSRALWDHAREARGEAEQLREEFALLLEKRHCCGKKQHWRWEMLTSSWQSATSDAAE